MKNRIFGWVMTIISVILLGFVICSSMNIVLLKQENNDLKEQITYENIELNSCPLCDGDVKLYPINEYYRIECHDCKLKTELFSSKVELIKYWNKE